MSEWYTPSQLGERLNIDVRTIQAQARRAEIPGAKKIGNQWRFNIQKINQWLDETVGLPRVREEELTPVSRAKLDRLREMRRSR